MSYLASYRQGHVSTSFCQKVYVDWPGGHFYKKAPWAQWAMIGRQKLLAAEVTVNVVFTPEKGLWIRNKIQDKPDLETSLFKR